MQKILYTGGDTFIGHCIHEGKVYVRDRNKLMIYSDDKCEVHTVGLYGGGQYLLSVLTGVVFLQESECGTDVMLIKNGSIMTLMSDIRGEIVQMQALNGGGVIVLAHDVYVVDEAGNLLSTISGMGENTWIMPMRNGDVGVLYNCFLFIHSQSGVLLEKVYIGYRDVGVPLELYDGRFVSDADNTIIIHPRRGGTMSYLDCEDGFRSCLQLHDGSLLLKHGIQMYIHDVCIETPCIRELFQMRDSRILMMTDRSITVYKLTGGIDVSYDVDKKINEMRYDGDRTVSYRCKNEIRTLTVPMKKIIYKRRLDNLSDMSVRFN